MKNVFRIVATLLLSVVIVFAVGCTKSDDSNNGSNNNGGNNGGEVNGINFNGHAYVDLGLPSGTLWATCNIGATTPDGYGYYYAWGETQIKDVYNWTTYKYCNGSFDQLTKYCDKANFGYNDYTDNLTILESNDDAASFHWGGDWHIPNRAQWQELFENTNSVFTNQNGVDGLLFTASNNCYLFLPAAGVRYESELSNHNKYGHYWSNSIDTSSPDNACYFFFSSNYSSMNVGLRDFGFSIRPVCSAK